MYKILCSYRSSRRYHDGTPEDAAAAILECLAFPKDLLNWHSLCVKIHAVLMESIHSTSQRCDCVMTVAAERKGASERAKEREGDRSCEKEVATMIAKRLDLLQLTPAARMSQAGGVNAPDGGL